MWRVTDLRFDKATRHSTARICHTRMVLPAAAGRGIVVTLQPVGCGMLCALQQQQLGLLSLVSGKQRTVRTIKIKMLCTETPGNRLTHSLRKKKTLSANHASYSARIELKSRPQVPDGLPVST